jgi:hypothetical protein
MTQFDAARRAALMGDLLRIVLGRPRDLLPFDQVRERLHLRRFVDRGVQEVPLDRIVGTVGRERDFNRAFLPRRESLRDRWGKMTELAEGPEGFPPVELYQVGDSYFVVDGHHRVSVARSMGHTTIEARVMEFLAPVPLSPDESLPDVIRKGGLADFLEATGLKQTEPDEYRVASVNGYERLLEHINGHRYFLGIERNAPVPWEEAVRSWHDTVYRPMIQTTRRSGILEEFPGLTETDLYLFTMDHLHHLRQRYHDRTIGPEEAVKTVRPEGGALRRILRSARSWLERVASRR